MKIKLEPGVTLLDGQYQLEEKLGEGGMASVWAAQQHTIPTLPTQVVLKILLHEVRKDEERRRMFLEEARLSAHLHHPYIVQIFSVEQWQNLDILVMERLWGHSLDTLLQQTHPPQVVPWPYAVKMISMAAQALHYANQEAHIQGQPLHLIHRDLKPANLLLTAAGVLKVIDFGVAKASTSQIHTRTGLVKGTVAYMSPEQLHADPLDVRSDLHSLGAVLYQICCGERPFLGENVTSVILKILNEIPEPLIQKVPHIPPSLSRLVDKLLSKDRIDRPADALMLFQQLEDLLVEEQHPVTPEDLQRYFRQQFPEIYQKWQYTQTPQTAEAFNPGTTLFEERSYMPPPSLQWNPITPKTSRSSAPPESESDDTLSQNSFPPPHALPNAPHNPTAFPQTAHPPESIQAQAVPPTPSATMSPALSQAQIQAKLAQLPFSPTQHLHDTPEELPETEPSAPAGSTVLDDDEQTVRRPHPNQALYPSSTPRVATSPFPIEQNSLHRSRSMGSEDTLTAPPEKTDPSHTHPDESDIPIALSKLREVLQQLPAESPTWLEPTPAQEQQTHPSKPSAHEFSTSLHPSEQSKPSLAYGVFVADTLQQPHPPSVQEPVASPYTISANAPASVPSSSPSAAFQAPYPPPQDSVSPSLETPTLAMIDPPPNLTPQTRSFLSPLRWNPKVMLAVTMIVLVLGWLLWQWLR